VTQTTAAIVHYQAALKAASGSFYRIYPPWAWLIWWQKYGSRAHDFFLARDKLALYLIAPGAALAAIAIIIARHVMSDEAPDLHGSARWANSDEIQQTGFLASRRRWFRRHIAAARDGIYLGMISRSKKSKFLKDCGIGHVLLFAPTRAGKGISTIIPTLTTWPHSTLIHDFKGELWHLTAGARKDMGQLVLKFDPTNTVDGVSVKFNPLEEVRLRSVHEAEDVQNIVRMIVDPDGKGLNDHWLKTGAGAAHRRHPPCPVRGVEQDSARCRRLPQRPEAHHR
jgi:type IV secretion system protein VirD4